MTHHRELIVQCWYIHSYQGKSEQTVSLQIQAPSYVLKIRYVFKSLADTKKEDIFLKAPYRLQPARFVLFFPALLQTPCLV